MSGIPQRERMEEVAACIAPFVRHTPLVQADAADFGLSAGPLWFKLECMQHAGSFKTRGAFANLLNREIPAAGVVAASGGNHGAAVAYAAHRLGIPAHIFVPAVSTPAKIARIRASGAQLEIGGERYADALEASERRALETGALQVHAFDQIETLLGQSGVGKEIEDDLPRVDTVIAAVGGGGLIGGIAAWFAGRARVIGVEPEEAPTLTRALERGEPVDAPAGGIAADSLAPRRVGTLMFPIAQRYVDRVLLVSDEHIVRAQRALWNELSVLAEPGGVAAFAAVHSGRYVPQSGERVCVVVSGSNAAVSF